MDQWRRRTIVDAPTPFAPRERWEQFQESLAKAPADDPAVIEGKAEATEMLALHDRLQDPAKVAAAWAKAQNPLPMAKLAVKARQVLNRGLKR